MMHDPKDMTNDDLLGALTDSMDTITIRSAQLEEARAAHLAIKKEIGDRMDKRRGPRSVSSKPSPIDDSIDNVADSA